jgi:hypothetical protein
MNPERQPNKEVFTPLAENEASQVEVERDPKSEAAKIIDTLMKAATEVNTNDSDPKAGKAAFQEAAA